MPLHSKFDIIKQLRVEAARLGCNVEKMIASFIDTANMLDEAVEGSDNLSTQLSASICREDAYKSELATVKKDLEK